jgi:hypothetical protein
MKKPNPKTILRGKGYAWAIYNEDDDRWEVCHWAAPTRHDLAHHGNRAPSPEARIYKVDIIPRIPKRRKKP